MPNPPSIRLEGDQKRALALVPRAKALLYRLQQLKASMGVPTYSLHERVDDDSEIWCLSSNGIEIITITVAPTVVGQPAPEFEYSSFAYPNFLSGLIYPGYMEPDPAATPDANGNIPARLNAFAPTGNTRKFTKLTPGYQYINRLAIEPSNTLPELREPDGYFTKFSQAVLLKPSMYSGQMAAAVSVVMGMGKLPVPIWNMLSKQSPAYAKQVKTTGVQVQYDYKWTRTHGIVTGADGKTRWLVEISNSRGVLAMKLPIYALTDQDFFMLRAINLGDEAIRRALLELGCLPTGEIFPADITNAKNVYRLLTPNELNEFYSLNPYSSGFGWCFSPDGTEAHNTGWGVHDSGYLYGDHWRVLLNFPAAKDDGTQPTPTATVAKVDTGFFYAPNFVLARYAPIKFYEPALGYVQSFDASPSFAPASPPPDCDTTMFVMYNQGSLELVKYFRNAGGSINEVDDPRSPGDCLYNNSWTVTAKTGTTVVGPAIYTTSIDKRQTFVARVDTQQIASIDFGYDPPTLFDFIVEPNWSYMSRNRVFKHTVDETVAAGEFAQCMVIVPAYCREAYYYAYNHGYQAYSTISSVTWDYLTDPYHYYGYRTLVPGEDQSPAPPSCKANACGTKHSERRVICEDFEPYPCSDYADNGSWASQCDNMDSMIGTVPSRHSTQTVVDKGTNQTFSLTLVANSGMTTFDISGFGASQMNIWMIPSPDPNSGTTQVILATYSALGEFGVIYENDLLGYGQTLVKGTVCTTPPGTMATYVGANAP